MTILAPLALLGLIALPVIYVLYMREDAPDQMRVPTTRFWTEAASERGRRFRQSRPPLTWLMLAQMLIALILVAALTRPLVPVGFLGAVGGAKQLFVLLDGSTSMSAADVAPTRFAAAKERAVGLVQNLAEDETATVFVLGSEVRMLGAGDGTDQLALVSRLRNLPAPGGHANFADALGVLRPLLSARQRNEIVIITDGGLLGADALDPNEKLPATIRVEYVTDGARTANNVAITQATTRAAQRSGDDEEFFARLANYGDAPAEVTLRPSFNDVPATEQKLMLGGGQTQDITFLMPRGTTKARLEAILPAPDAFPADNTAEVVARGARGTRAVLVTAQPGADSPLVRALRAAPNLRVEVLDANSRPDLGNVGASFLVLDGVIPDLTTLPPRTPVLFVNPQAGGTAISVTGVANTVSTPRLTDTGTRDPLLRDVDFAGVQFARLPVVERVPWLRPLAETQQGPLLLSGERDGRRLVVFAPQVTADVTNFVARVAFPVLIANIVDYLAPPALPSSVQPGATVSIAPVIGSEQVAVTRPDGRTRTFPVVGDRTPVPFSATESPGVYRVVYTGGGRELSTDAFTVNVGDELESDLRPRRTLDFTAIAGGNDPNAGIGAGEQRGVGIAPWLLGGVLLLLAAEWLVISRRRGSRQSAVGSR